MIRTRPLRDATSLVGDAAALRRAADEDGYLYCKDLVSIADVLDVRDFVLEHARDHEWLAPGTRERAGIAAPDFVMGAYDDPRWIALLQRVLVHASFRRLGEAPRVRDVLASLLGAVEPHHGDILRVVTGDDPAHATKPHQDAFYIRDVPSLWTAWIPLGDCPMELGPIAVLAGSQHDGLLEHQGEGMGEQGVDVSAEVTWSASNLDAGDVVFFSGHTIHRALPHRMGKRLRLSADYRFCSRHDAH
jgi:ectoine hydroxylase-related dioxygenase (phytanoyl-CoA dioxygenase family)